jgi:hypothetical protein
MDFAKFVSLIHRRALFFPNAASLGDPFEGSYPMANIRLRPTWYGEYAESMERQGYGEKLRLLQSTLISCWHMNPVESAAMWRLYASQGYGIAVRSTYERLTRAFEIDRPLYIGTVIYLDYDTDPMPEGNLFDPFVHKRASFRHEQELRAVTDRYVPPGTSTQWEVSKGPPLYFGDYIPTDINVLVDDVVVGPGAAPWFVETVRATAEHFDIEAVVRSSDLDQPPQY